MNETLPELYRDKSGDIPDELPATTEHSPNRKPRWKHARQLQAAERNKFLYVQQYRLWGDSTKARKACGGKTHAIQRHVVQRWIDQDEDFKMALTAIDEMWYAIRHQDFVDLAGMSIMGVQACIAQSDDMRLKLTASQFVLKGSGIGRESTTVEHTGPGGGPILIAKVEYDRLPPRERKAIEVSVVHEEEAEG